MTDAEFVQSLVAQWRKQGSVYPEVILDALEALAKLKWNQHILWCIDPGAGKMCERCEALRKFRAAVEGEVSAPRLRENWQSALRSLEAGWDSYNAVPITPEALATVGSFTVIPCGNGGIQLEVHRDGYDIEIVIGPEGRITSALIAVMEGAARATTPPDPDALTGCADDQLPRATVDAMKKYLHATTPPAEQKVGE